jgi:hypothetical protein
MLRPQRFWRCSQSPDSQVMVGNMIMQIYLLEARLTIVTAWLVKNFDLRPYGLPS